MSIEGDRIKAIRKAKNLTQEAFGKEIEISKTHISDVERGEKNLSSSAIELLKIRFAISELWWETGTPPMFNGINNFLDKAPSELTPEETEIFGKFAEKELVPAIQKALDPIVEAINNELQKMPARKRTDVLGYCQDINEGKTPPAEVVPIRERYTKSKAA